MMFPLGKNNHMHPVGSQYGRLIIYAEFRSKKKQKNNRNTLGKGALLHKGLFFFV